MGKCDNVRRYIVVDTVEAMERGAVNEFGNAEQYDEYDCGSVVLDLSHNPPLVLGDDLYVDCREESTLARGWSWVADALNAAYKAGLQDGQADD